MRVSCDPDTVVPMPMRVDRGITIESEDDLSAVFVTLSAALATHARPVVLMLAAGPRSTPGADRRLGHDLLIDPLTPREAEVLDHLSELLSTEEIAEAMFVSVNTVRTHVRGILRKLAVSRRSDAVRRARALRLVDP
jgi:DNA-binding CsgD family transcriptional regulator